jgi:dihydrodipicolinate synthase/N-acetylneuraminate lyase
MTSDVKSDRDGIVKRAITPTGAVPRLWCPPITHYTDSGAVDRSRMAAHWRTMTAHVGGFLVPGSTGEAWDMSAEEIRALLEVAIELAVELDTRLLIGALRPTVAEMHATITETLERLRAATGESDALTAMRLRHVAGFTVCPPRGADLSQDEIEVGLSSILDLGLPTAIYQLPQVTQNEIAPATFAALAARYPNFLLFKDTSGTDRVPEADRGIAGVTLVRGAEEDYAKWLREAGGPYYGFLLSTANGFARELGQVIALSEAGDLGGAAALSGKLTGVVSAAFAAVADIPHANGFANANKAFDHVMAYGPDAGGVAPPLLHGGVRLPREVIDEVAGILADAGLVPERGYLALQ